MLFGDFFKSFAAHISTWHFLSAKRDFVSGGTLGTLEINVDWLKRGSCTIS